MFFALLLAATVSLAAATFIVASLLPIVSGIIVKADASDRVKGGVAIVVAIVATILRRAVDSGTDLVVDSDLIVEAITMVAVQLATYLGFWKPVVNINARTFPGFGLGKGAS